MDKTYALHDLPLVSSSSRAESLDPQAIREDIMDAILVDLSVALDHIRAAADQRLAEIDAILATTRDTLAQLQSVVPPPPDAAEERLAEMVRAELAEPLPWTDRLFAPRPLDLLISAAAATAGYVAVRRMLRPAIPTPQQE